MSNLYFILEDVNKNLRLTDPNDIQEICNLYGLEVVESIQTDKIPDSVITRKVIYINLPNGKKKTILHCKIVNEKKFVLSQFRYKIPTNKEYAKIFDELKVADIESKDLQQQEAV